MSRLTKHLDQVDSDYGKIVAILEDTAKRTKTESQGAVVASQVSVVEAFHNSVKQKNVAYAIAVKNDANKARFKDYVSSLD